MAKRDYGTMDGTGSIGPSIDENKYRLVYWATHDGGGNSDVSLNRLPYMYRSFISFSFGYKEKRITEGNKDKLITVPVYIEDFNLIATFSNDRLNRNGYADFKDNTSTYDNLDGLYYWSTHYTTNSLDFTLSTDGISQTDLDKFLHWFLAGVTRELILSEHPNRAILARVANPPQLNLLPFEEPIKITISDATYETSTTVYKGDITLKFIMDSPFWYSKTNILGILDDDTKRYTNNWVDLNRNIVSIFLSKDALKILHEDGIPLGSAIQDNMLLGNGEFANVEEHYESLIWNPKESEIVWTDGVPSGVGARIAGTITQVEIDAINDGLSSDKLIIKWPAGTYIGVVAGAVISPNGNIKSLGTYNSEVPATVGAFYYAGTAPAPTILEFTMTPIRDSNNEYIHTPGNSYSLDTHNLPYSWICIESLLALKLYLTTPNVYTSYNKAIDIFKNKIVKDAEWETIRNMIRDNVHHKYVREWAINKLNSEILSNTVVEANGIATLLRTLCDAMWTFFQNSGGEVLPATFTFNSETGEAIGEFKFRSIQDANHLDGIKLVESKEDVGDMLRSNYLVLRDRNYPLSNGLIVKWNENHKLTAYRIYHNFDIPLNDISIRYKNMYL